MGGKKKRIRFRENKAYRHKKTLSSIVPGRKKGKK